MGAGAGLDPSPAQTQKVVLFKVAQEFPQASQLSSSYLLLIGEMAEINLKELDEITSSKSCMRAKELT